MVVLLAVVLWANSGSSHPAHAPVKASPHGNRTVPAGPPHLSVSVGSWQLSASVSRAVALPVDGKIDVLGGLSGTGDSTTPAITEYDPVTGVAKPAGSLPVPVHDAAGAVIGSRSFVFGGGAASITADSQSLSEAVAQGTPAAAVAGRLPTPRADLTSAVGADGTVYLAGGFDGTSFTPAVLTTKDGATFNPLGQLPVPVRYPAAAVVGHQLLVIGGETGSAPTTAAEVGTDDIQAADVGTGQVTIAGHLPVPLSHASAAVLDGSIYVFGGRSAGHVVDTVYKLVVGPLGYSATSAGSLPLPTSDMAVATLGQTVYLIGGEGQLAQPGRSVIIARMVTPAASTGAGTTSAPFTGDLLIADRGNDRLLLVDAQKHLLWLFPSLLHPAPAAGFYFPDDAFFINHGTAIITNQEDQNTIEELAYPSGRLIALYGHPNVAGTGPGYLNQPDDAFVLNNGEVTVADAKNCRILFLNPNFTYTITGFVNGAIPTDVAYPNGDTPLADGNFLVSEIIGSYVDEVTEAGQVVWSVKLPIAYPSDPQQLGPDLYLVADYSTPGGILKFNREGQILWRYQVPAGEGMLDHPSLAEQFPNGLICVNDDYRHRVVIIDPNSQQIVWQYGDTDTAGSTPGLLKIPDGFDLLLPDRTTPTHLPASGDGNPNPTAPATSTTAVP